MKKPKAPKLVTVAIMTTITIVFWIFFTLYNILIKETLLEIDPKLLEPLTPTLDSTSLSKLEGRIFYEEGEVTTPLITAVSPTPVATPIPQEETPPQATSEAGFEEF